MKTKIHISISAADHDFTKNQRVIVKAGTNEWYIGTIVTAGKKLKIDFDDGNHAVVDPEDFKDVKVMTKSKKLKRSLTNAEAKELYAVVKAAPAAKAKPAAKASPVKVKPTAGEAPQSAESKLLAKAKYQKGDRVRRDPKTWKIGVHDEKTNTGTVVAPQVGMDNKDKPMLSYRVHFDSGNMAVYGEKELVALKEPASKPMSIRAAKKAMEAASPVKVKQHSVLEKLLAPEGPKPLPYHLYGHMILVKYNTGPKWEFCHNSTSSTVQVGSSSTKLRSIKRRFVLDAREATTAEKEQFAGQRKETITKKLDGMGVDEGRMVLVNFSDGQSWKYCYRINETKGTFSVAGGGGKMRDLPLTHALQSRDATPDETAAATSRKADMDTRLGNLATRRNSRKDLRMFGL